MLDNEHKKNPTWKFFMNDPLKKMIMIIYQK